MTIFNLYKQHLAGAVTKQKFLYEARRDSNLPWITNLTSFDDAVKILKNKGIIAEERGISFEDAKAEAQRISDEEGGVAQHVNSIGNGRYEVSDWYDSDTTEWSAGLNEDHAEKGVMGIKLTPDSEEDKEAIESFLYANKLVAEWDPEGYYFISAETPEDLNSNFETIKDEVAFGDANLNVTIEKLNGFSKKISEEETIKEFEGNQIVYDEDGNEVPDDYLASILKSSNSIGDFVNKVNYGITNVETRVSSANDTAIRNWYRNHKKDLNEAIDQKEEIISAIDKMNPSLVMAAAKFELEKMSEITDENFVKAQAKAVKKLMKDPHAYDDLVVSNSKEMEKKDSNLRMREVKKDNIIDKPNEMKKVRGITKDKSNTKASKKENKRGMPKGVKKMPTPGKETILEAIKSILNENYNSKYGIGQSIQTPDGEGIIKEINNGTLTVEVNECGCERDYQINVIDHSMTNPKPKSIPEPSVDPVMPMKEQTSDIETWISEFITDIEIGPYGWVDIPYAEMQLADALGRDPKKDELAKVLVALSKNDNLYNADDTDPEEKGTKVTKQEIVDYLKTVKEAIALKDKAGNVQYAKDSSEATELEKKAKEKGVALTKSNV